MDDQIVVVARLIREHPMCVDCIAERNQIHSQDVEALLKRITVVLILHTESSRCPSCGASTQIYWTGQPRS